MTRKQVVAGLGFSIVFALFVVVITTDTISTSKLKPASVKDEHSKNNTSSKSQQGPLNTQKDMEIDQANKVSQSMLENRAEIYVQSSQNEALSDAEKEYISQSLSTDTSDANLSYQQNDDGQLLKAIDNNPDSPNYLKTMKTYDWYEGRVVAISRYQYAGNEKIVTRLQVQFSPSGEPMAYKETESRIREGN